MTEVKNWLVEFMKAQTPKEITQEEWDRIKSEMKTLSEAIADGRLIVKPATSSEDEGDPQATKVGRTEAIGKLVPIYVEDSYIGWWKGHMRISLSESVSGKTNWRVSLLMEEGDAKALAAQINKVLGKMEKEYGSPTQPDIDDLI